MAGANVRAGWLAHADAIGPGAPDWQAFGQKGGISIGKPVSLIIYIMLNDNRQSGVARPPQRESPNVAATKMAAAKIKAQLKIGRAPSRERVCRYVSFSMVAASLTKQNTKKIKTTN